MDNLGKRGDGQSGRPDLGPLRPQVRPAAGPIRVLLVDDNKQVLRGLKLLLSLEPDLLIAGEAGDGLTAIALAEQLRPDVVLMDVTMPGMDGIHAAALLRDLVPDTRVLILSMSDGKATREQARAGNVAGFLSKCDAGDALVEAIRAVARGPQMRA